MRFNILTGQLERDRRCEGSQSNRKTGVPRVFTEIAEKPRGRIICMRSAHTRTSGATETGRHGNVEQASPTLQQISTIYTDTAGILDISAANGPLFERWEPSNLMEDAS